MDLDLIETDLEVETYEEVIKKLGYTMQKKNYVKDTYVGAVLKRESNLPTGLNLNGFGVAIPHTDSQHVNMAMVAIGVLRNPVKFHCMIDPKSEVPVQLVFLLAIKDPDKQVELLQRLMSLFQDVSLLKKIQTETKQNIAKIMEKIIC